MYKNNTVRNTAIIDLFLGDSGKGKISDYLAGRHNSVVRFNGANNAGHTLRIGESEYKTHAVPSGILYPNVTNFIGHGCCIDPFVLAEEIDQFKDHNDKIFISGQAHLILPGHISRDKKKEEVFKVGSTCRGVSPAYSDKAARAGLRYEDLLLSSSELSEKAREMKIAYEFHEETQMIDYLYVHEQLSNKLRPYIVEDGVEFIHDLARQGPILFEGAQGCFLDIDVGNYPYVTSSNCNVGAVFSGTGLNWRQLHDVVGVIKAYGSYVGTRTDFPDIENEKLSSHLSELGQEFGATTGRKRRLCWLDLDQISKASAINGPTKLAVTKMDILGQLSEVHLKYKGELVEFTPWGDLSGISSMDDLPESAKSYISFIEEILQVPVWAVGTGPKRSDLIFQEG